jgi:excinuclease ABC subunit A
VVGDDMHEPTIDTLAVLKHLSPKKRATLVDKLRKFATTAKVDANQPLSTWPSAKRQQLLQGDGKRFAGLLIELEKLLATSTSDKLRERLESLRAEVTCADCDGTRLKREARCSLVGGLAIFEFTKLAIDDALAHLATTRFTSDKQPLAEPIVAEIVERLTFLQRAGIGYLSLDRPASTLSGGEHQRVRLATAIGSGLVGVLYLLDEPSMGLHPRDTQRLIEILRDLQQQGNTVVVVEHDEAFMQAADYLIDIGPGAGRDGGRVVAQGTPDEVKSHAIDSVTADYLAGRRRIAPRPHRRVRRKSKQIQLYGATLHNLQSVDFELPLGLFVAVGGVSGSGKSSLVLDTLSRAVAAKLHGSSKPAGPYKSLQGVAQIDRIVRVDQSAIGRSPRSNAATYTGLFDEIRKLYAQTKLARQRGYKIGRFSFNVQGGRCEACQGQGAQRIEMKFLPDLYVTCPECRGRRFNRQSLAVLYRGRSIADVLAMSVDEALEFFAELAEMRRMLQALADVGLGYLPIGQPSNTLSGGEAQRIKLAAELGRPAGGHTLFVLDEPTTGLHTQNVAQLLDVLHQIVELGNTVLMVEHHPAVLASADWLVELGPEGGTGGGQIIAQGLPEEVASNAASVTGRWLREVLD